MISLTKTSSYSTSLHPAHVPLFARDISNPNEDKINALYKRLIEKSNGKNPTFWSKMTPVDYISSIFALGGALSTLFSFQSESKVPRNIGLSVFFFGVGTFIYGLFNKITLNPISKPQNSISDLHSNKSPSAEESTLFPKETIYDMIKIIKNQKLDFSDRESAYDRLHENLSYTESLPTEYDSFLHDLQEFNSQRENEIARLEPIIDKLIINFKTSLGESETQKQKFGKNFRDILAFINDRSYPTTCRSKILNTTIKLIKDKWKEIDSVSTCVQEIFNCLFEWIEESPRHPNSSEEMPIMLLTKAMEKIQDLSKEIKRNLNISGHDYSKYDDFILNLEPLLKSENYNLQEAARSIYKHTSHPLGIKPLIESLRVFNPSQVNNRISNSEHRSKVELIVKEILENLGITVGSDPFHKIEVTLRKELFDYLNDTNNDILIVTSKLVNPNDEKVCNKLADLLDKDNIVLKTTLINVLEHHTDNKFVKEKFNKMVNDSNENPFIRYNIARVLNNTNIDRTELLIESLNSENSDIVDFAAFRLGLDKVNDIKILNPLIMACRKDSLDAFFTLHSCGFKTAESGLNIDQFIEEELPKLIELKKYSKRHINRRKAEDILKIISERKTQIQNT